jgi:STIP1 family protein 1
MALLKLSNWPAVITASNASIALLPENMKAHYYLAQAQIALHSTADAVVNAKLAHKFCVKEVESGGKGAGSLGVITELVLRCVKEDWERREDERLAGRKGLCGEVVASLERERDGRIARLDGEGVDGVVESLRKDYGGRIEEVRRVFEEAGKVDREARRRKVPDWAVDDITFSVMVDPVMVSFCSVDCAL